RNLINFMVPLAVVQVSTMSLWSFLYCSKSFCSSVSLSLVRSWAWTCSDCLLTTAIIAAYNCPLVTFSGSVGGKGTPTFYYGSISGSGSGSGSGSDGTYPPATSPTVIVCQN